MRRCYIGILIILFGLITAIAVYAGNPFYPPDVPANTNSYTLTDIYQRLHRGAPGTPATFSEPHYGPTTGTGYTLEDIVKIAPYVDNLYGATPAEVAVGKTFWGLQAGNWGLLTGTGQISPTFLAPVLRTGQTQSYVARDDGALQAGVIWPVPRFTDNGDGTVTDNLTGLIWLKNYSCLGWRIWTSAVSAVNALNSGECGLSDGSREGDWHLPSIRELASLLDFSRQRPCLPIGHPFINVSTTRDVWSGTSATSSSPNAAWAVDFSICLVGLSNKQTMSSHVWPVRDPRISAPAGADKLDSTAPPESTWEYTLTDIYQRLDAGTSVSPSLFTEPVSGAISSTHPTLNEIMAKAPLVDNRHGASPADVAVGRIFWGIRTDYWGILTGTAGISPTYPAPVQRTGQIVSYAAGDDGALQTGIIWPTPRFTDHGDGTVTDNLTGLVWLKNAHCFGRETWTEALVDANTLNSGECGLSDSSSEGDWRLANAQELFSLIDFSRVGPPLPTGHPFINVYTSHYWSSTSSTTSYGMVVNMQSGMIDDTDKTYVFGVWPVRDGQ